MCFLVLVSSWSVLSFERSDRESVTKSSYLIFEGIEAVEDGGIAFFLGLPGLRLGTNACWRISCRVFLRFFDPTGLPRFFFGEVVESKEGVEDVLAWFTVGVDSPKDGGEGCIQSSGEFEAVRVKSACGFSGVCGSLGVMVRKICCGASRNGLKRRGIYGRKPWFIFWH